MKRYIAISRCSSEEQRKKGNSHDTQQKGIQGHSIVESWKLVKEIRETVSGWKFSANRDEINKIYAFCKRKPDFVNYIIFQKVDRFYRNTQKAWATIEKFKAIGVEINFIDNWINYEVPGAHLMLNIYLGLAQSESHNTSRRTKQNLQAIKAKGYYVGSFPPKGFAKEILPNHRKTLVPDNTDTLKVLQFIFKSYLYGDVTRAYLMKTAGQLSISRNQFYTLFQNPAYAGLNEIVTKGESKYIEAHWFPHRILEKEEFEMMKTKVAKDGATNSKTVTKTEKFWLKGHLFSKEGLRHTASSPKGRNKRYSYYHTGKKGGKNLRVNEAHDLIIKLFSAMKIKDGVVRKIELAVENDLKAKRIERKKQKGIVTRELQKIEERLKEINNQFAIGELDLSEYKNLKEIIEEQKSKRVMQFSDLQEDLLLKNKILAESLKRIPNILKHFKSADIELRSTVLKTFFPNGFYLDLENCKVGISKVNRIAFQLIDIESVMKFFEPKKGQSLQTVLAGVDDITLMDNKDILSLRRLMEISKVKLA